MTPISYFDDIWRRCDEIQGLHAHLTNVLTGVLSADELLRAEWVARVSALDLFVHELVLQNVVEIFQGIRPNCAGYNRIPCSTETVQRVHNASNLVDATLAFTLDIKSKLSRITFQYPNDIADGIRMFSTCELWNEIAIKRGANSSTQADVAKSLKKDLSLIVERRNKIAHEGDLQPTTPRTPWPINRTDVDTAATIIENLVRDIDAIV